MRPASSAPAAEAAEDGARTHDVTGRITATYLACAARMKHDLKREFCFDSGHLKTRDTAADRRVVATWTRRRWEEKV
jgi:hypothetical protein